MKVEYKRNVIWNYFSPFPPSPWPLLWGGKLCGQEGGKLGKPSHNYVREYFRACVLAFIKIVLLLPHSLHLSLYQTTKNRGQLGFLKNKRLLRIYSKWKFLDFFRTVFFSGDFYKDHYHYPVLLHYFVITSRNANVHCAISMGVKRENKM